MYLRFSRVLPAAIALFMPLKAFAGGEWPDGPNKAWFQNFERPDNHLNPMRDQMSRN